MDHARRKRATKRFGERQATRLPSPMPERGVLATDDQWLGRAQGTCAGAQRAEPSFR